MEGVIGYIKLAEYDIDAMIYTRGAKSEWDRYAELGGNDGLKWDNVLPLLMKVIFSSTSRKLNNMLTG